MSKPVPIILSWCLLCIGILLYVRNQVWHASAFATMNDFWHLYLAGYLGWAGGDFFDVNMMLAATREVGIRAGINPFVYPPFFAILLFPLSALSVPVSWFVFTAISHAALLASIALLIHLFRKPGESLLLWWGIWLAFAGLFFPLWKNYSAGQMNTFMLLFISGALWCLMRHRPVLCGIILGLGASIKVSPVFLLFYLAWKRKWKGLASGLVTIIVATLISLATFGWSAHAGFLNEAADMGYGSSTWAEHGMRFHVEPHNQAPAALWYRLLSHEHPGIQGIANSTTLAKACSYLTALAIMGLLLWTSRPKANLDPRMEMSFWTIAMLLLPSLMWDHYLVQAFIAWAAAFRLIRDGHSKYSFTLIAGLLLMVMPMVYDHPWFRSDIWVVGVNLKLFGLLLVAFYLWVHRNALIQD